MEEAKKQGLHEKVKILAGVTPLKSAGMAKFMKKMVAGMDIPDEVIKRMAAEPKEKQAAKGIEMCIEQIQELKEMEGIAGVHVMAIEWEEKLNEIIGGAGLLPRPVVDDKGAKAIVRIRAYHSKEEIMAEKKKILLVDDDPDFVAAVKVIVEKGGYDVGCL
jgi:hypothetical protein